MSYLSQPASSTLYGVVQIGSNIQVTDGIISVAQNLLPNSSVIFNNISATGNLTLNGDTVVTSVLPQAGAGINISNITSSGPNSSFTVQNTGVLHLFAGNGITLSSNTGNVTISSVGADLINVIGVTTNYTALDTDEYIGVDSVSAVTITLPTGIPGRVYTIKDEHGQGSGKINIVGTGGQLIDNSASYIISVPYQSVSLVFRSGQWRLI